MARVNLLSGTYQARSVIADAQRCINLFPEMNPHDDQDHPVTHYLSPGTSHLVSPNSGPASGVSRLNYRASNGDFYRVVGPNVYYVAPNWDHTFLGNIDPNQNICSMTDNGLVVVLVDGTSRGYAIDMLSRSFSQVTSPYFFGADKADYLDTFFIFNKTGTNQFYISLSNVTFAIVTGSVGGLLSGSIVAGGTGYIDGTYTNVPLLNGTGTGAFATFVVSGGVVVTVTPTAPGQGYLIGDQLSVDNANLGGSGSGFDFGIEEISGAGFDALDLAAKTGSPDPIVTLAVVHTEIWLLGQLTSEVWYNAGAADFTFQRLPGTFVEHGIVAIYSLAKEDLALFWLSQDREGQAIVVRGQNYVATRISTHAIENAINNYNTITDAIGFMYQQEGHAFYVLVFPSAGKTWVYDRSTELWHERAFTDTNGYLQRIRGNTLANVYGTIVLGDYANGDLLKYSLNTTTDYVDGAGPNSDGSYPISRIRAFPHLVNNMDRVMYRDFTADMEAGTDDSSVDGSTPLNPPMLSLRWSDDRGKTYGNKLEQSLGAGGEYLTSAQWNRLGMARDRVFELSWSSPTKTALQGAFINAMTAAT